MFWNVKHKCGCSLNKYVSNCFFQIRTSSFPHGTDHKSSICGVSYRKERLSNLSKMFQRPLQLHLKHSLKQYESIIKPQTGVKKKNQSSWRQKDPFQTKHLDSNLSRCRISEVENRCCGQWTEDLRCSCYRPANQRLLISAETREFTAGGISLLLLPPECDVTSCLAGRDFLPFTAWPHHHPS